MRKLVILAAGVGILACSPGVQPAPTSVAPSPATVQPPVTEAKQPPAVATFPTDDAVLKQIWTEGMDNTQTKQLSHILMDSVGPRLTGSPNMKAANDWLVRMYTSWGINAKNEQYGTWRGWRRGTQSIDLLSPRVRSLEGTMLAWSPGTNNRPVIGTAVILPMFADSNEFARWLPQARGKYVLISSPKLSCRPTADWNQFGSASARAFYAADTAKNNAEWRARTRGTGYSTGLSGGALSKRIDAAGAAGVLTTRPTDAVGAISIFETYNVNSPGIALSCEDYGLVYRLAESGMSPQIRVTADAALLGEQPVFNTIATIPGTTKADEFIVLSAHFDSWDGSSGATDNGTGTIVMMEAMRILKKVYPNPKRTIIVGHWSSEEQGLNGSRAWTEDHPEVLAKLQAIYNQDNGTGRIQSVSGGGGLVGINDHLQAWKAKLPKEFTDSIQYRASANVPGSPGGTDGAVFACKATPSFGLSSSGWNYGSETWHTNRDTFDKIVFDDVRRNATLTAMLVYLSSEDPELISRTKVEGGPWPDCGKAPRSTTGRM